MRKYSCYIGLNHPATVANRSQPNASGSKNEAIIANTYGFNIVQLLNPLAVMINRSQPVASGSLSVANNFGYNTFGYIIL